MHRNCQIFNLKTKIFHSFFHLDLFQTVLASFALSHSIQMPTYKRYVGGLVRNMPPSVPELGSIRLFSKYEHRCLRLALEQVLST